MGNTSWWMWTYIFALLLPFASCTKQKHVIFVSVDGGTERAIAASAIATYLQSLDGHAYFTDVASFSSAAHIYDKKRVIDQPAEAQSLQNTLGAFRNSIYGGPRWSAAISGGKHRKSLQPFKHVKGNAYHYYIVADPKQTDDRVIADVKKSVREQVQSFGPHTYSVDVRVLGVVADPRSGQDARLQHFSATLRYAGMLLRLRTLLDKFSFHHEAHLWHLDAMKRKWRNEWREWGDYFYDTELDTLESREQDLMGRYEGGNRCLSNADCDTLYDWDCKCDKLAGKQCEIKKQAQGQEASAGNSETKPCPFHAFGGEPEAYALFTIVAPVEAPPGTKIKVHGAQEAIAGEDAGYEYYDIDAYDDDDEDDDAEEEEYMYHYMKAEDYTDAGMFTYRAYMTMFSIFTMISLCVCLLVGCCCGALFGFVTYQTRKKNRTLENM